MQLILYTILFFFATVIGAATGTGGGAVLKPLLDFAAMDTAATISVYSAIAVFTMCISSIIKSLKRGLSFSWHILLSLSLGSVIGGLLGDRLFKQALTLMSNELIIFIQSLGLLLVLITLLVITQYSESLPTLKVRQPFTLFCLGSLVGAISIFLGIGGGPLNIIVLMGLMSYSPKESVAYSLSMIFFSQIPKILTLIVTLNEQEFDVIIVPIIVIASILGGFVGTLIYQRLTEKQVRLLYFIMIVFLLAICLANMFRNI